MNDHDAKCIPSERGAERLYDAWIPTAALKDPALSAGARLLWILLAGCQGQSEEGFPLEEMLAEHLGVKVRQLQTYLKELANYARGEPLEPAPLIAVKRVWVAQERKTRNMHRLLQHPLLAVNRLANGADEANAADGGNAQSSAHRAGGKRKMEQPAGWPCPVIRKTLQSRLRDLQFSPNTPARHGTPCRPAMRSLLRIRQEEIHRMPLLGDQQSPAKTAAWDQTLPLLRGLLTPHHRAIRNPLRIGYRAAAPPRGICTRSVRYSLTARRKMPLLGDRPLRAKMTVWDQTLRLLRGLLTPHRPAIRNPLRIGHRAAAPPRGTGTRSARYSPSGNSASRQVR